MAVSADARRKPGLQGKWANGTVAPIERLSGVGAIQTPARAARLEQIRVDATEAPSQPSGSMSEPARKATISGVERSQGARVQEREAAAIQPEER